ncbi:SH3 domain, partial [Trinorchestia longiramus]
VPSFTPSLEFEITRRRVGRGVQEWWWYVEDQLRDLRSKLDTFPNYVEQINAIIDNGAEHSRVARHDLHHLSNADGLSVWREREAAELSALVQARLHALQHPADCTSARKLTCSLNKGCGYGCQIHHAVYCFIMAYGTKRTLILKSQGWRYNRAGWEDVFKPLSSTCTDPSGGWKVHWPGNNNSQVLDLPIIDSLAHRPAFLPPAIPKDLSERITRLHGNPAAWWIGQFLKYMLKPQPKLQQILDSMTEQMNFHGPIVGVHVRRTDKIGTEAAFHPIEEYMRYVEEYFTDLSLTNPSVKRRVYIASDDPNVVKDAKNKYPNYEVLGDPDIAKSASLATRYSDSALKGIIADIHFLSLTDYLVCTFSSQVCRIAYEIMQTMHPDASSYFHSLDDIYYYGGQSSHNQKVRFNHVPRRSNEMSMNKGDIIGIAGNHWNGYSKGVNKRTRQNALYPSYKAEDVVVTADCPTYEE